MKRIALVIVAGLAIALPAAAATARTSPAKVSTRQTGLGRVLTNGRGFTLYVFTRDSRGHDRCLSAAPCSTVWPLLKTAGRPVAGPGVRRSLLGTITLSGGGRQVTYAGHPLYTYIGDGGPGQTDYVGAQQFGGSWYAISPSGKIVR